MNIKKDFNIEIIPLFHFKQYSEIYEQYKQSKPLEFNIILINKITNKTVSIKYTMGCGHLKLYRLNSGRAVNISGEYIKEMKYIKLNNEIKPTIDDIVECVESDISVLSDYTMGEFIEAFDYTASKGIDVYNACLLEYNNLKDSYRN